MKVCDTGGAGLIGSYLVDRLLGDGHEVAVLDNLSAGRLENLSVVSTSVRFVDGDLPDPGAGASAVAGAEVVSHHAALASVARSLEVPEEVTAVNAAGTLNVLRAARAARSRRVILASSSSVCGDAPTLPKAETMPSWWRSPDAAREVAGEADLAAFHGAYGMETVSFRYFNVSGPRQRSDSQYAAAIPLFLEAMAQGRSTVIHGDGEQTRDITFNSDVVDAVTEAAVAEGTPDGPRNLGSGGHRTLINHLAEVIADAVGFEGEVVNGPARARDVRDSLADLAASSTWLGWQPRVSLEEGIGFTGAGSRAAQRV